MRELRKKFTLVLDAEQINNVARHIAKLEAELLARECPNCGGRPENPCDPEELKEMEV